MPSLAEGTPAVVRAPPDNTTPVRRVSRMGMNRIPFPCRDGRRYFPRGFCIPCDNILSVIRTLPPSVNDPYPAVYAPIELSLSLLDRATPRTR
jgi:hypothetical protein